MLTTASKIRSNWFVGQYEIETVFTYIIASTHQHSLVFVSFPSIVNDEGVQDG